MISSNSQASSFRKTNSGTPSSMDMMKRQTEKQQHALPISDAAFSDLGIELSVGIPCVVHYNENHIRFKALVRYIGYVQGVSNAFMLNVDWLKSDPFNSYLGHGLELKSII